jgi:calcineurin-like phosphoesterase
MSAADFYATRPVAPFNKSGTNFGVVLFDATATSQVHAMPLDWDGCFVELTATEPVVYAFSTNPSAAVDYAAAGTAAGLTAAVGGLLPADIPVRVFIPRISVGETLYFVRDAAGAAEVRIIKSSQRI